MRVICGPLLHHNLHDSGSKVGSGIVTSFPKPNGIGLTCDLIHQIPAVNLCCGIGQARTFAACDQAHDA